MKRLADNLEVLSYSGVLLKDVRCSRFFNQLHYSHVKKRKKKKKKSNKVAHSLVRYGKYISNFVVCSGGAT